MVISLALFSGSESTLCVQQVSCQFALGPPLGGKLISPLSVQPAERGRIEPHSSQFVEGPVNHFNVTLLSVAVEGYQTGEAFVHVHSKEEANTPNGMFMPNKLKIKNEMN